MIMKGIILAGGNGTRLYPLTKAISKQLLPIYNKPMIYYPLSILILSGIKKILIITTPQDEEQYKRLLSDGNQFGCQFEYAIQEQPNGIAQAFIVGEKFIGNDNVVLILGDNLFYSTHLIEYIQKLKTIDGAYIFAKEVPDPERYGIVEFDDNNQPVSIEEKPIKPKSKYAITGLYFYDNNVINFAKKIQPSKRGEYEITDINQLYLDRNKLQVYPLDKESIWLDTGTIESFNEASQIVRQIENDKQILIGSIEEASFKMNFINDQQLKKLIEPLINTNYGLYLRQLIEQKENRK